MSIFWFQRVALLLSFTQPYNQKSHGFKSGDLGGQAFWNDLLMTFHQMCYKETEWRDEEFEVKLYHVYEQLSAMIFLL